MRTRRGLEGVFLLAWGALGATGGTAAAELAVADKAALDKLLYDAFKDMHNRAADLYNAGDPNGCYRMFQGGLLMARPLLAHRPEEQKAIDQGMQAADRNPSIPHRSRILHETIAKVRDRLKPAAPVKPTGTPSPPPAASPPSPRPMTPLPQSGGPVLDAPGPIGVAPALLQTPAPAPAAPRAPAAPDTLWKRLGGEEKVTQVVDDFLTLTLDDKTVNFSRNGAYKFDKEKVEDLKYKLVAYLSSLSEGTVVAASTKGLADIHRGMKIQESEFNAFVESLRFALMKNGVAAKDAEELMAKVKAARKDVVAAPDGP